MPSTPEARCTTTSSFGKVAISQVAFDPWLAARHLSASWRQLATAVSLVNKR